MNNLLLPTVTMTSYNLNTNVCGRWLEKGKGRGGGGMFSVSFQKIKAVIIRRDSVMPVVFMLSCFLF